MYVWFIGCTVMPLGQSQRCVRQLACYHLFTKRHLDLGTDSLSVVAYKRYTHGGGVAAGMSYFNSTQHTALKPPSDGRSVVIQQKEWRSLWLRNELKGLSAQSHSAASVRQQALWHRIFIFILCQRHWLIRERPVLPSLICWDTRKKPKPKPNSVCLEVKPWSPPFLGLDKNAEEGEREERELMSENLPFAVNLLNMCWHINKHT